MLIRLFRPLGAKPLRKIIARNSLLSAASEKHLAVYVYATNGGPWRAVIDLEPDPVLPDVPPEISDIWIFTEARNENEFAVWRASVSSPWRKIETVVL